MKKFLLGLSLLLSVMAGNAADTNSVTTNPSLSATNTLPIDESTNIARERKKCLDKYCTYRQRILFSFNISDTASADDVKKRLVPIFLGISGDTSWEKLLEDKRVQEMCTEERRIKFAHMFCGDEKAGWLTILETVERMRLSRRK